MGVQKKLIGIVGALLLALVGTFLVLNNSGGGGEEALTREQVPMLVAGQSLTAGTTVDKLLSTEGMVHVAMVNIEDKNPDALSAVADLNDYKGLVVSEDVEPNGALLTTTFVDRSRLAIGAGGVEVPADMLQISFSLEPQRALGGSLRAGDRIAVVGSFGVIDESTPDTKTVELTHIVVQKALVANVQLANLANATDTGSVDAAPSVVGNYMVTLALSAPDTERLTYALENGKIWLAKQPDANSGEGSKIWDVGQTLNDPVTQYAVPAQ
jgi:pilus assembly protein CpaB